MTDEPSVSRETSHSTVTAPAQTAAPQAAEEAANADTSDAHSVPVQQGTAPEAAPPEGQSVTEPLPADPSAAGAAELADSVIAPAHHGDTVNLALAADMHDEPDDDAEETMGTGETDAVGTAMPPAQRAPLHFPRPAAPRVMVVANQKGGVGKTTTTVNLAVALARGGLRVLVIDLDPQGNASTALSVEHGRDLPSIYDALVDGTALDDLARPVAEAENVWIVPANVDLAGAEIELVSVVARENRLRKALAGLRGLQPGAEDRLDYVLIDCPPSLGLLTLNALVAAEEMLVPIQAEYYALEGVGQLLETVELVRANLNPALHISTVVMTMYDARTRLSAAVADEVRAHFGDKVVRTTVPRSVRVSEAPSFGQSVLAYDPTSTGALSYLEVAREIAVRAPARPAAQHATPSPVTT